MNDRYSEISLEALRSSRARLSGNGRSDDRRADATASALRRLMKTAKSRHLALRHLRRSGGADGVGAGG